MPTLIRYFEPAIDVGIEATEVRDLDDAIQHVLDDEQWVHDTTEVGTCDTIVMWDEDNYRFYLYVEFENTDNIISIPSPQLDTYELTRE